MFFKKKKKPPPPPFQNRPAKPNNPPPTTPFPWPLLGVLVFCAWFVSDSLAPNLPKHTEPIRLYSNQCQQDLRATLLNAIKGAQSSIYLVMFGLSDRAILSSLIQKIRRDIPTTVYYDSTGSPKLGKILDGGKIYPVKSAGL